MKVLPVLLSFLIMSTAICAQTTPKALLQFESSAFKISATNNGQLIITTRAGEVAITSSMEKNWRLLNPVKNDKETFTSGILLDNSNFFNADTGFVSGFISNKGVYDIIYRTTNGGRSWQAVNFNQSGWVDDAIHLSKGEAWMSISGSGIAYTKDFGLNWKKLNIPEIRQRFSVIYFSEKHEGVIGSLWNKIAYTNDNCANWKFIPTPLDQKKYKKTNTESRPEINKIAIWGNKFLVKQEDIVFWTERDSIDWKELKSVSNFYTDVDNSALYLQNASGVFLKVDEQLKTIASFSVAENCYDATCKNGNLFIMAGQKLIKLSAGNKIESNFIYGNDTVSVKPSNFGYTSSGIWGNIAQKIYRQKEYKEAWEYQFDLPFTVDSGSLRMMGDDRIVLYSKNDTLYYYNIYSGTVRKKKSIDIMNDFCSAEIEKITFSKGSQGCFHGYEDKMIYLENNGSFYLFEESDKEANRETKLADNNKSILTKDVNTFIKKLPSVLYKQATISDLGFTNAHYEACRKGIIEFKNSIEQKKVKTRKLEKGGFEFYKNNLDFDRLLALVDSIKNIDSTLLYNTLMGLSQNWSTTSNWQTIKFENRNHQLLTIINTYYEPNAFGFPWTINIDGFTCFTTCIDINLFIKKVYPLFLDDSRKVDVLYTLVKRMY